MDGKAEVYRPGLASASSSAESVALIIEEMGPGPGPVLGNLGTGLLKSGDEIFSLLLWGQ